MTQLYRNLLANMSNHTNLYVKDSFFSVLQQRIASSRNRIYIIIYNWYFYKDKKECKIEIINDLILKKNAEGVDVKVVVGNRTLLNFLREKNIKVRYNKLRGLNHAKVIIVDDDWCSVGSHNLSENALTRNEEASVVSTDKNLIDQCLLYFNNLYSQCY